MSFRLVVCYPRVTQGGTTCWENWSGDADSQHPPPPTHNHIFLCSSTFWFYTTLLGISQPDGLDTSVGYDNAVLAPPLIDSLDAMAGSLKTVRGPFALSWSWDGAPMGSTFALNATIPPNARSTIKVRVLPAEKERERKRERERRGDT